MNRDLAPRPRRGARRRGRLLWGAALVLMLAAAVWQRRSGPTYPVRGEVAVGSQTVRYRLIRSHETASGAAIEVPAAGASAGTLHWRRYPSDEPWSEVPMRAGPADGLGATLPPQPPAGKVEYYVTLAGPEGPVRLPGDGDSVILRYKDPVPAMLLIPHVAAMFLAVLIGLRAGLEALFRPVGVRRLAWTALLLTTIGGLVLGPAVQHRAFGEWWTGVPFGWDVTDNKTLLMWLAWAGACAAIGLPRRERRGGRTGDTGVSPTGRWIVAAATAVMLAVYLVPHSLRGSELDYEAVERGVDPAEAIGTG